jgi:3-hydroxyisobutyrate dehydrogenase-like beta-hydroxyacid dehydrogenase
MDIGFIGLGNMGSAMVRALLKAGHSVVVYNRSASKAEAMRQLGATVARDICDACRGDAVITMVSDDAAVEQIVCGDHGVLACLPPNKTVHVSMSTISPALVQRLAERHAERNQHFFSAPVLGRPDVAEQGKLFVLAAGAQDLIDWMMPMFGAVAQKTFIVGNQPPAANIVKLACNAMIASMIEALGETLALVVKSGLVEPKAFVDVLLSTLLSTPSYRPYAEHLLKRQFTPGFKIPLALKDMELALGAAKDNSVPMPIVSLIRDHLIEAIAAGYGNLDWSALALVAQREAGLPQA